MNMKPALLPLLILALFLHGLTPTLLSQVAGAPAYVDYQGTVFDGTTSAPLGSAGTAPNFTAAPKNYTMQFRIYDQQTGGTLIYAETQTVTVSLGQFAVRLGAGASISGSETVGPPTLSIANAFNAKERFLELTAIVPPATSGTPITPRLAFQASPFAFVAERAKLADTATVANTVTGVSGSTFTGTVNASGGTFSGGTFGTSPAPATFVGNGAALTALNADNISSGTLADARLSNNVALLNRSPQTFTGATNVFDGQVGIGKTPSTDPGVTLDVSGSITATNGIVTTSQVTAGGWDGHNFFGDSNSGLFSTAADKVAVRTGGTDRLTVTANGNVGIGWTDPQALLHIRGTGTQCRMERPGSYWDWIVHDTTGDLEMFHNGVAKGRFNVSGGYTALSDRRFKMRIEPLEPTLERVMKLVASSYWFKSAPDAPQRSLGLIAQDVQKLFPEVVSGTEADDDFLSLSYSSLVPVLVKAVQELKSAQDTQAQTSVREKEELTQRVVAAEKKVAELETQAQARDKAVAALLVRDKEREARLIALEKQLQSSDKSTVHTVALKQDTASR